MMKQWAFGALGLLILSGCGAQPSLPVAPKVPKPPKQVVGIPTPGAGGAQPGAPAGAVDALLAQMVAAERTLQSASWKGMMYCRGSWGNKPKNLNKLANGEWEAHSTYQTTYKKPEHYKVAITACTNPASIGVQMLIKNQNVKAKLPGLLGVVPFERTLADKELKNFRGHRLDYGTFNGIAKRLGALPAPDAKVVGQMPLENRVLDLIEFNRTPAFDRTIVKEVVGIDRTTHLPLYHAMYTGERKVYELKYMSLKTGISIPGDFYSL